MDAKLSIGRAALVAVVLGTTLGEGFWAGQATAQREYQPRMRSALTSLKEAKTHLEKASIDKRRSSGSSATFNKPGNYRS